jgi:4-hydroxybenzoate polyprenyltransferase
MTSSLEPTSEDIARAPARPTLSGHIQIARVDHWVKNVFVLPGILFALSIDPHPVLDGLVMRLLFGLAAICLVASSNYVINELMDAPFDRHHPVKSLRPVPAGLVNVPLAYVQWIGLMVAGLALAWKVSVPFTVTAAALWVMGCIYNLPPVRSKDVVYVDVLSEAINNPLRMLAGWYIASDNLRVPFSLLFSYWFIGCYFMAMKRLAEYEEIADQGRAARYRKSFSFYTRERLLVAIMFYGSAAMLLFGAFIMRYRIELIVAFPIIALIMAIYLALAFKPNSPVQHPERLHREPLLMVTIVACVVLMVGLLFIDIPILQEWFPPAVPLGLGHGWLRP